MINTASEDNLEDQLKSSFDQIIKVIEEKCFKITENVTEENKLLRNEIQQLHNEVKEEKHLYQKMTENVTEENIMLRNEIHKLHNERLDLTKRLEVIIKNTHDRY